MNQTTVAQQAKTASFLPPAQGILQRKCACGGSPGVDGECAGCRQKRLQRKSAGQATATGAPPIVHEMLHSFGSIARADADRPFARCLPRSRWEDIYELCTPNI